MDVFPWSCAIHIHHYGNAAVQSFVYDIMSLLDTMSEVSIIPISMQTIADISEVALQDSLGNHSATSAQYSALAVSCLGNPFRSKE